MSGNSRISEADHSHLRQPSYICRYFKLLAIKTVTSLASTPSAHHIFMSTHNVESGKIDLDSPRWDQRTFLGRLKHYFWVTDYRTVIVPSKKLLEAKELVQLYKKGQAPPGTTEEQLWYAKKLYESAFHPDTGDLQNVIGRMSFQVPGGMIITAGMLQFYRTNSAVILWQWINQTFNVLVNYTNRNAASALTTKQMGIAYVSATTSAIVTAVGLKSFLTTRASGLMQRFVPFVAVSAANVVNIPLSRQSELQNGVALFDKDGNRVTESRYAAAKGISQVVFSRIFMAAPGLLTMPFIMEYLEKKPAFMRYKVLHLPFQTFMIGVFLTFMTPTACSLFPQRSNITMSRLQSVEPEKYEKAVNFYADSQLPDRLYFNKGL